MNELELAAFVEHVATDRFINVGPEFPDLLVDTDVWPMTLRDADIACEGLRRRTGFEWHIELFSLSAETNEP